ncbi:MAG: hypothetical protein QG604_135 [Candidatus Dependentiae bacterium]|nr:hypothetical protein [Candidatus Dependentiae bacterium]
MDTLFKSRVISFLSLLIVVFSVSIGLLASAEEEEVLPLPIGIGNYSQSLHPLYEGKGEDRVIASCYVKEDQIDMYIFSADIDPWEAGSIPRDQLSHYYGEAERVRRVDSRKNHSHRLRFAREPLRAPIDLEEPSLSAVWAEKKDRPEETASSFFSIYVSPRLTVFVPMEFCKRFATDVTGPEPYFAQASIPKKSWFGSFGLGSAALAKHTLFDKLSTGAAAGGPLSVKQVFFAVCALVCYQVFGSIYLPYRENAFQYDCVLDPLVLIRIAQCLFVPSIVRTLEDDLEAGGDSLRSLVDCQAAQMRALAADMAAREVRIISNTKVIQATKYRPLDDDCRSVAASSVSLSSPGSRTVSSAGTPPFSGRVGHVEMSPLSLSSPVLNRSIDSYQIVGLGRLATLDAESSDSDQDEAESDPESDESEGVEGCDDLDDEEHETEVI